MTTTRKRLGAPRRLDGRQTTSLSLDRKGRSNLNYLQRTALAQGSTANASRVVRTLLEAARHKTELGDAFAARAREDAEKLELQRRLEQAELARQRAEARAELARKSATRSKSFMEGLLRHLPLVRDRAARGPNIETGIQILDQVWHNAGRSWARVQARLEDVQRKLQPEPPPPLPVEAPP